MDLFMTMYENTQKYCISSDMLSECGILSIKPNKLTLQSSDIDNLLKRLNLVKDIDYELRRHEKSQLSADGINHGTKTRNVFMLTTKAFKICLMNSTN